MPWTCVSSSTIVLYRYIVKIMFRLYRIKEKYGEVILNRSRAEIALLCRSVRSVLNRSCAPKWHRLVPRRHSRYAANTTGCALLYLTDFNHPERYALLQFNLNLTQGYNHCKFSVLSLRSFLSTTLLAVVCCAVCMPIWLVKTDLSQFQGYKFFFNIDYLKK